MNKKDLGYDRHGLLDIPVEDRSIFHSWAAFRNDLKSISEVKGVTRSLVIPTDQRYTDNPHLVRNNPEPFFPIINRIDQNFIPVMGIKMVAGENFTWEMLKDSVRYYYILNETASRTFGFSSPADAIGKEIGVLVGENNESDRWGEIVGVCADFNFQSLTEVIKPMVLSASLVGHNHITMRVDENAKEIANRKVLELWKKYFPGKVYSSKFVSQNFNAQHLTEKRLRTILLIFTILSVFVACLGLLGLSVFSLEQRKKEIGIRKSMGAEVFQIVRLISSEFTRLVILSNLIAMPVAYFVIREWLRNFPYHRGIEVWVFILAAVLAWFAAILTILVQTCRAGRLNPAEVLKYE